MKKEIISLTILLLVFAGTLINIKVNDHLIEELETEVKGAYSSLSSGDFSKAEEAVNAVTERWLRLDGYTHIFIRHSEISSTTEAFFNFMADVKSADADSAKGSYGLLMAQLDSLKTMEHISIGSIF